MDDLGHLAEEGLGERVVLLDGDDAVPEPVELEATAAPKRPSPMTRTSSSYSRFRAMTSSPAGRSARPLPPSGRRGASLPVACPSCRHRPG